jgi:hypothetical protein
MNTRTAGMFAFAASLMVLLSGCGGAAADAGGSAELGLARGRVITDELGRIAARDSTVRATEARAWSAEALREFHGVQTAAPTGRAGWGAEALREFHGIQATAPVSRAGWSDEIVRELKGSEPIPVPRTFTSELLRELKGSSSGTDGDR